MAEFLTLLPPDEARALLLSHLPMPVIATETIEVASALGRVCAEDIRAPHPLPAFPRSSVDGYAVRASDTYGANESLPAYLPLAGEVPMGGAPPFALQAGRCMLIHTGGMLPENADAVVMLEYTQQTHTADGSIEVEVLRSVAKGENVIAIGEDVAEGQVVQAAGRVMRPAEIGGLMALGVTELRVVKKTRVGLISSGDEVIPPHLWPRPGQVRDINSYTLAALVEQTGAEARLYGIARDSFDVLQSMAARALEECDLLVFTAGSSASTRDMTAEVIDTLGRPGVLVHGVNTRPGKPTILGVCNGKAVIGLPGNPVSALVNGYLFVVPVLERSMGVRPRPKAVVQAQLAVNLPSQAGREDWWPVKLLPTAARVDKEAAAEPRSSIAYVADPIFGKSNLIFTLAAADGLLRIPPDATGLAAGEVVEVVLL